MRRRSTSPYVYLQKPRLLSMLRVRSCTKCTNGASLSNWPTSLASRLKKKKKKRGPLNIRRNINAAKAKQRLATLFFGDLTVQTLQRDRLAVVLLFFFLFFVFCRPHNESGANSLLLFRVWPRLTGQSGLHL